MCFLNCRIGWSFSTWCGQLQSGTLKRRRASFSNCRIIPSTASSGTSCEQQNSKRWFSLGVTLSLGRQARTRSTKNAATVLRNGSNCGQSLQGHCCVIHGKSAAMRTLDLKRPTWPTTKNTCFGVRRFDLESNYEARVQRARNGAFSVTRNCALIQHMHGHTHKHTNDPWYLSSPQCCTRATPLKNV